MQSLQQFLDSVTLSEPAPDTTLRGLVLALVMAFLLGKLLAWTYRATHSGVSFSRSFTSSLVQLTMISSMILFVVGSSIVMAFGLIGAVTLIRFRNVLKDTRDTTFIFVALIVGLALGSGRHEVAVTGTLAFLLVTWYLFLVSFGAPTRVHGHLTRRLAAAADQPSSAQADGVLRRFCRRIQQRSVHHAGDSVEYVYEVRLRDRRRVHELVEALRAVPGTEDVALVLRNEAAEL